MNCIFFPFSTFHDKVQLKCFSRDLNAGKVAFFFLKGWELYISPSQMAI